MLRLLPLVAACSLLASLASAQTLPLPGMLPGSRQPGAEGTAASDPATPGRLPIVGAWVEYRFRRGAEAPMRVRYALVERTSDGDWLETQYVRNANDRLLVRVLIEGRIDDAGRIKRVIVQQGSMQALELPTNRGTEALPPRVPTGASAETIGTESVQVGGRSLSTRHIRAREGPAVTDAWVSTDVPLWGLVRFSSRRFQLDLLGFGEGARSALVGEPIRFDPAQLGHR